MFYSFSACSTGVFFLKATYQPSGTARGQGGETQSLASAELPGMQATCSYSPYFI